MRTMNVLALNSGSSSLKFGLYGVQAAGIETLLAETVSTADAQAAIIRVATVLGRSGMPAPAVIGHRIVHGGPQLREHCLN